jgi:hypothetical protein
VDYKNNPYDKVNILTTDLEKHVHKGKMQKRGGIVALIGGILGALAGVFTLWWSTFVAAFQNLEGVAVDDSVPLQIAESRLMGIVFGFCAIILGAIAKRAKSLTPGGLLILCAIGGAITGGNLVAYCMVLVFVGGVLAMIGVKKSQKEPV